MGRVLEGACILLLFVGLQNGARNVYVVKVDLQVVPAKRRRTPGPPTPNAPPLSPPAGDALDPRYGKVPNKCARALIYSLSPSTPPPPTSHTLPCHWATSHPGREQTCSWPLPPIALQTHCQRDRPQDFVPGTRVPRSGLPAARYMSQYLVLNFITFILGDYTDECMYSFKGYPKMFKGWFKAQQEARQ